MGGGGFNDINGLRVVVVMFRVGRSMIGKGIKPARDENVKNCKLTA